jgi:hypothetical protein
MYAPGIRKRPRANEGYSMPDDSFEIECDRLSKVVDDVQFERVRWARDEAPMLDRLVELAQAAVKDRPDIELVDEGSKGPIKRYVLKVHGFRIVSVSLGLEAGTVAVWGEAIERSKYRIVNGQRHSVDFQQLNEAWMKDTLRALMGEIQ